MISTHLLILQVVIPLIAAPLCIIARRPSLVWYLVLLVSWSTFYIACQLLSLVLTHSVISYDLGGWAAPWGIEYRLDILNAFVLLLVTSISAVVILFARDSVKKEIAEDRIYLFYTAYLLNLAGLIGVIITGDVFNLFVFIEISSLSSYALISLGQHKRALLAAFRYLILGTIGATFILIGIGLLYAITGTLNMSDLSYRLQFVDQSRTVITALAFLTVGICIKFALFPLHAWLPNAYTYAPSVVSTFLASTTTKVFIYVLLRFLFTIFGSTLVFAEMGLNYILLVFALLAVFSGTISAIYQTDVKRLLAYSSIAQIGYMVLGISLVSVTGLLAGIVHLFNHALMKSALFMCMGCVYYRIGSVRLPDMGGLGRSMPWTMAAFVLAGFSLVGIPLTAGFISKWYLIQASLEQDFWWLAAAILISSLLAIVYLWKVVEVAYFRPHTEIPATHPVKEAPVLMLVPLWILIIANIYFGIHTDLTVDLAHLAAETILEARQ